MKILVVGSGGREHALVWKLAQTPGTQLFCAPGNGGIASQAECVPIGVEEFDKLARFAKDKAIDLTVVGPEVPLVKGIVDYFKRRNLRVFGPSKKAAMLEGSKIFSKRLMRDHGIPTGEFQVFTQAEKAYAYLRKATYPQVIKADGLAAGKGVVVAKDAAEALCAVADIMVKGIHGQAGKRILVEECLTGQEVSVLALTDGKDMLVLPPAQDHKRILDGDQGPNTGGMGAYSPTPLLSEEMLEGVRQEILQKTIDAMAKDGRPFAGVLYAGLMLTRDGPKVLEFNVRFGDPEVQAVLPRVEGDLAEILLACAEGRLRDVSLKISPEYSVCVVMAAGGYPGPYAKGEEIHGLEAAAALPKACVFHAGTKKEDASIRSAGGRVLGVTAWGVDLPAAIAGAYEAVSKIQFKDAFYRKDIGQKALAAT